METRQCLCQGMKSITTTKTLTCQLELAKSLAVKKTVTTKLSVIFLEDHLDSYVNPKPSFLALP